MCTNIYTKYALIMQSKIINKQPTLAYSQSIAHTRPQTIINNQRCILHIALDQRNFKFAND